MKNADSWRAPLTGKKEECRFMANHAYNGERNPMAPPWACPAKVKYDMEVQGASLNCAGRH